MRWLDRPAEATAPNGRVANLALLGLGVAVASARQNPSHGREQHLVPGASTLTHASRNLQRDLETRHSAALVCGPLIL